MKILRGIWTGALLWVLIFFEVSILMFGFKLTGTLYYVVHYILLAFLIIIVSLIYFRARRINAGIKQGLFLGIIYIIVGAILDSVITIPLFMNFNYSFLIQSEMLFSWLETLVLCFIVGGLKD